MRWDNLRVSGADQAALPGLPTGAALATAQGAARRVEVPEFPGVVFHEVLAKSALNRVDARSKMPFEWTINPYRGCQHACTYCFARPTHEYLGLNPGADFDNQIVVKVNTVAVLRHELATRSSLPSLVALGTNTDPYQRAEGRYQLMPGIVSALAEREVPLSILTKSTLLQRDLELLRRVSRVTELTLGVTIPMAVDDLRRELEPGAPSISARLRMVARLTAQQLPVQVFVAPVLPFLQDSRAQIRAHLASLAAAGASSVRFEVLHLRPGVKPWFMANLRKSFPHLVAKYEDLYRYGSNPRPSYLVEMQQLMAGEIAAAGLAPSRSVRVSNAVVRDAPQPSLF